jgi:hypothetical protein
VYSNLDAIESPDEGELWDSIFVYYRIFLGINLALWIGTIVASWVFYLNEMRKKSKLWSIITLCIALITKIITIDFVVGIVLMILIGLAWN